MSQFFSPFQKLSVFFIQKWEIGIIIQVEKMIINVEKQESVKNVEGTGTNENEGS